MMYAHIRPDRIYETGVIDPYNPADPPSAAMNTVARFKRAPWMGETGKNLSGPLGQSPVPAGQPPVHFQQQLALITRIFTAMTPAQQGITIMQLYRLR